VRSGLITEDDDALCELVRLAREIGAHAISHDARRGRSLHALVFRLRAFIGEHDRALGRSPGELETRIECLAVACGRAEAILAARDAAHDLAAARLTARLRIERRKFLMSVMADAAISLEQQIAALDPRRPHRRRKAIDAARDTALHLLATLAERQRRLVNAAIAADTRDMMHAVDAALGMVADVLVQAPVVNREITSPARYRDELARNELFAFPLHVGDLFGLGAQEHLRERAGDVLAAALAAGAQAIEDELLEADRTVRDELAARYQEALDGAVDAARKAAELARVSCTARELAAARRIVHDWSRALNAIAARLP
jgi:hypothetical protein